LRGSVHTLKENSGGLVVAGNVTGLQVNTDKTKYMVISGDHNVALSCSLKIGNIFFQKGGRGQIFGNMFDVY
jgi:hypothetical protein